MNKICTTIEQSKKLIELGIDVETADMSYQHFIPDVYIPQLYEQDEEDDIPAWSLAALLDLLPSVIIRNGKIMFLTMEKEGTYNLYYKSEDRLDELQETKEELIDACYEMIVRLKENNKI